MARLGKSSTSGPFRGVDAQFEAVAISATVLNVQFDQVVALIGLPGWRADDVLALSAEQVSPTEINITYPAGTFTAGADIVIPQHDRGIRSRTGGYVAQQMFPVVAPD